MFVPRVDKKVPRDDKAEYRAWLIEILREQGRRYEKVPVEFHGHFSEKELADDTPVSEEKKLSHDKKRKSTVLSPQHISSVKKSKKEKEKNKNKNKEYEKEETKIKKIRCTTMLAIVDRFVNEKTSSFEMKLKNMERLLNQLLDKDNQVGPVPVYVSRLV